MGDDRLLITEAGFLTEFLNQHTQRTERPFCFILGAGVSRSSGIFTGGEMANVWLRELYEAENFDGLSLEEWATSERLGIEGFKLRDVASFYPQLYQRKYGDNDQSGFAFLESQMEGKEPSYGYSVLSYLLSETSHRVVITTNFDNLVADALSIHSSRFPLVIGHDALAQYATVELRRPLVAKVHGALGFSPKSQPDAISDLPEGWCVALKRILDRYTPIVIGYEGNDGSLMGFLKSLPSEIPDRVFWCVYGPSISGTECLKLVSEDVREYVRSRHGRLVPIGGFDELMAKLLTKLREKGSVPDLYERLQQRARQRERNYDEQQRRLFEAAVSPEARDRSTAEPGNADHGLSLAVSEIAESRKDKPWWVWQKEADAAPNTAQEEIYEQAVKALPDSSPMLRGYALYLFNAGKYDEAENFYQRAVKADPKDRLALAFYATFLEVARRNPEQAGEYYKRALEAAPDDAYVVGSYADFLYRTRQDLEQAEKSFEKAIQLDPRSAHNLTRFAIFLKEVRGDNARAAELEQRASEIKNTN